MKPQTFAVKLARALMENKEFSLEDVKNMITTQLDAEDAEEALHQAIKEEISHEGMKVFLPIAKQVEADQQQRWREQIARKAQERAEAKAATV